MIDSRAVRQQIDLLALAGADTRLRKVASTNGGEYAGPCPFCGGHDRFRVQPEAGRWWCRQCAGEHWGDAIDYVMRRDHVKFADAIAQLGGSHGTQEIARGTRTGKETGATPATPATPSATAEPTPGWRRAALEIVERSEATLWSEPGAIARRWLSERRGLTEATLRRWHVGFNPALQTIAGLRAEPGVTLPWFVDGELWQVKIRRPRGEPRYVSLPGGHPLLYLADTLAGRAVAVLTEGEFDALLLWQEAGDLVGVATLGSASKALDARAMAYLLPVPRLFVAYDADDAGDHGATVLLNLSARMHRLRPLVGKDITEFCQAGGHLRDWLQFALARLDGETGLLPPTERQPVRVSCSFCAAYIGTPSVEAVGFVEGGRPACSAHGGISLVSDGDGE